MAYSAWKSGMLPKLLQDTGQLPQQRIVFVSRTKVEKMSVAPRLRNAVARVMFRKHKLDHVTPIL